MRCIGDECTDRTNKRRERGEPARLWRSVALGALCAGVGALVAQQNAQRIDYAQAASFAPPIVMTSALGAARTGE